MSFIDVAKDQRQYHPITTQVSLITGGAWMADYRRCFSGLLSLPRPSLIWIDESQGFGRPEEALALTCLENHGSIWMVGDPVQPVGASPFILFRTWLADLTARRVGLAQEGVLYSTPVNYRLAMAQWIARRNAFNHRGGRTNPSTTMENCSVAVISRQLANIDIGQQAQQIHHALCL